MRRILPHVMGVLAAVGLADSAYLALAHLELLGVAPALTARACPIGPGPCQLALRSEHSLIFGVPVAILGVAYFAALVASSVVRLGAGSWPLPRLLAAMLTLGLAYSGYLTSTLLQMSAPCPYCLAVHAINALCAACGVASLVLDRAAGVGRRRLAANT